MADKSRTTLSLQRSLGRPRGLFPCNEGDDLIKFWKKMTILDAINGVTQSWNKIKPITLVQSWRKILPNIEGDFLDSIEPETSEIVPI